MMGEASKYQYDYEIGRGGGGVERVVKTANLPIAIKLANVNSKANLMGLANTISDCNERHRKLDSSKRV